MFRYDTSYNLLDTWGSINVATNADGDFSISSGLFVDASGRVLVAERGNHYVQVFDTDGTFIGKFGSLGTGEQNFHSPVVVAMFGTNISVLEDGNDRISQWTD